MRILIGGGAAAASKCSVWLSAEECALSTGKPYVRSSFFFCMVRALKRLPRGRPSVILKSVSWG